MQTICSGVVAMNDGDGISPFDRFNRSENRLLQVALIVSLYQVSKHFRIGF